MILQIATAVLLPAAATFGWVWGKREATHRPSRVDNRLRNNYFKGLNYLINEEPDKAVDVFVALLEVDSDTVETHLALGNLFRRRGEVDRAIRVHQNLIARPQLDKSYKMLALSALGQDYLHAGVLDRAERLFLELVDMNEQLPTSLRYLLRIYEQEKEWEKAIRIAQRLQLVSGEVNSQVISQYYCELAEQLRDRGHHNDALNNLKRAQSINPACVRASFLRARLEREAGRIKEAIRSYKRVKQQDPDFISETVEPLSECYRYLGDEEKLVNYLRECLREHPRISLALALAKKIQRERGDKSAIEFLAHQIQMRPSLRGLSYLVDLYIANSTGDAKEKLQMLQSFIGNLLEDKPTYRCLHCGYSGNMLFWICPSCFHWETIKPMQGIEGW